MQLYCLSAVNANHQKYIQRSSIYFYGMGIYQNPLHMRGLYSDLSCDAMKPIRTVVRLLNVDGFCAAVSLTQDFFYHITFQLEVSLAEHDIC